ncbi:MAG: class I SAM-dependent methyltransferase family protein [Thermoplasmata archaeon]
MKSQCISVPSLKGEEVRKALLEKGMLKKNLAIARNDEFIYFPLIRGEERKVLGYEVIERDFWVLQKRSKNYKDVVEVPENLRASLPSSFDVVGRVAIIKLQDELLGYKKEIGEAILKANKSIETVAIDAGVEGVDRVRRLEIVAGKMSTETIHKEYGIELEIDPIKVYFSPRLATEHWRIAQMVKEGEVVIDMFCGVGPFSIMIAKHRNPKKDYALDVNEEAIHYLKRNIERNKVSNVRALHGDSKILVPNLESADRIIMNLPFSSFEFLPIAISNLKKNGVIHYYEVLSDDKKDDRLEDIVRSARMQDIGIIKLGERAVHTYSPGSSLYCFDLKVDKDDGNVRPD